MTFFAIFLSGADLVSARLPKATPPGRKRRNRAKGKEQALAKRKPTKNKRNQHNYSPVTLNNANHSGSLLPGQGCQRIARFLQSCALITRHGIFTFFFFLSSFSHPLITATAQSSLDFAGDKLRPPIKLSKWRLQPSWAEAGFRGFVSCYLAGTVTATVTLSVTLSVEVSACLEPGA